MVVLVDMLLGALPDSDGSGRLSTGQVTEVRGDVQSQQNGLWQTDQRGAWAMVKSKAVAPEVEGAGVVAADQYDNDGTIRLMGEFVSAQILRCVIAATPDVRPRSRGATEAGPCP